MSDLEKKDIELMEFAVAEEELKHLKEESGEAKPEGKISRAITNFFDSRENRELIPVKKKTYIWLAVLTGWFGGHRFYCRHYKVALLYLCFFWIGLGLYNTIVDLIIVGPKPADDNGFIYL